VTNAGSGSRILRLRRKIPLLFGEKSFETVCFDSFILIEKWFIKDTRLSVGGDLLDMHLSFRPK
jgi:hypothetical protein